jgi:hypothetical protein
MKNYTRYVMLPFFVLLISFGSVSATWVQGDMSLSGVQQNPLYKEYTKTDASALGVGLSYNAPDAKPQAIIHAEFGPSSSQVAKNRGALNIGERNTTSAKLSSAIGRRNEVAGRDSIAIGTKNFVKGPESMAFGTGIENNHQRSIFMGNYSDPINGASGYDAPLFVVGNGKNVSNQSNAMVIDQAGDVGLGTNIPKEKLHMVDGKFRYEDGTQATGYVLTSDADGVASWQAPVASGGSNLPTCLDQEILVFDALSSSWVCDSQQVSGTDFDWEVDVNKQSMIATFGIQGNTLNSLIIGQQSVSIGNDNIIEANRSLAIGLNNKVRNVNNLTDSLSHVLGSGNNIKGSRNFVTGSNNIVIANDSTALGRDHQIIGDYNTTIGRQNAILGVGANNSAIIGYKNGINSSGNSYAFGYNQTLEGADEGLAIGFGNSSIHGTKRTLMFGKQLSATTSEFYAIGQYNNAPPVGSPTSTDQLFVVGNGTSNANVSNAMTILKNGNLGLQDVTDPQGMIHGHDGIGGKLVWTTDNLGTTGNTTQTIVDGGVSIARTEFLIVDSNGNTADWPLTLSNMVSNFQIQVNPSAATPELEVELTPAGEIIIHRINGTATYKVIAEITWL